MPTYKFEALDTAGAEVKDEIDALNEEEAQQKIKQMGYFVTKLTAMGVNTKTKKKKKTGKSRKTFTIGGVSNKMLCTFTRQFSTLQDAGLPVLRSLRILERQMKPSTLKNNLIDVVDDVESGSTLSEAMAKHPRCFDRLYVNMVRAGEAGGALEIILQRLADFKEKAQSLKRKIIGAMVYPAVVIMVAVGILTFIMISIIPKFKKIFEEFNMKLPAPTQILIDTSNWFADYWWTIPMFPMGLYLLIKLIRLSRAGTYALDRMLLWVPVVGNLVEKTIVARTMRTLGTLVASGVPILEALSIVRDTANNAVFERMFTRVYESIREGDTIAEPLKESRLVDDMVCNMVEVGEETGDLDSMLYKIADFYDEEVDTAVKSLISLIEPLMIVVLGFIIGAIVISLFLPLIKLLEGLSK
ncbi:type II secretion system F family protein [Telmatocola sphagniphila]|uniref:Type II secretion system F family protein n=1 Tax=Telmatocola sphagniphila TaxID=1123043 RepID=A0A8E6EX14_9BACT|nr:type II secretion system F family protein [Telmatocola sphagniphila]QVL30776.1 type II secretion system F family protein [Telmatocola sphagniphila]